MLLHFLKPLLMVKLSSKLQNIKNKVLNQCLPILTRFFTSLRFRKKQENRKEKNPNPNPTVTITLPEDLVEEILHRLAVKSLIRFKSVSKSWRSLIESSHFVEKHLQLRRKLYGAEEMKIVFEGTRNIQGLFYVRKNTVRVPGSCNGLVCVYNLANVYLINPMTNVKRKLTPPRGKRLSVGFGRDIVTGTYKVAVLYRVYHENDKNGYDNVNDDEENEVFRVETMVFDLRTNEWRQRYKTAGSMPFPFYLLRQERNPVFANGSLFWLLERYKILVMDLHAEKFRVISQPQDIIALSSSSSSLYVPIYMWCLEDSLCVSNLRGCPDLYVWILLVGDDDEIRWERRRLVPGIVPPLMLNSAWYSQTLASPYQ